ncbi:MAG: ABC transporter substrate-binding protein [Desulfovibrionaceae bacterium]|nr:ABC transporter substrate-binding protein [Desulfovibrionaceae bacterium]
MLYKYAFSALSLVVLLVPSGVEATESVTLAVFSREWAPFEMVVDGRAGGASLDLFKALMPDGVALAVETLPAPRSVLHQRGAPVYARLEAKGWWTRDADKYLWSNPVVSLESVLYSPAGKPVEYVNEESLYNLRIGCIRNYVYPEVQNLFVSGKAERYDVNDDILLLRMLKAGRVDVAVFDSISAAWLIRQTPDMRAADFHVAEKPLGVAHLRFVFNMDENWKRRLPEINAKIRAGRADGTIDRILKQYR